MLYNIIYIFILFLMYSVLGWLVEVTNAFIFQKRFINRGFLIGPYCPIYGVGIILIIFSLKNYTDNFLVLFILSMAICMVLEYITSYLMEVLFHARWWDYSNKKFNINGRVCLETTIPFGLGGLLIMYVINPIFTGILNKLSHKVLLIVGITLLVIFITDLILSFIIILKFRNTKINENKDSTEDFNKKIKEYLINNSRWNKRLIESFPYIKIKIDKFKKRSIK